MDYMSIILLLLLPSKITLKESYIRNDYFKKKKNDGDEQYCKLY